jgi:phosphonate dehydrogenase
MTPSRPLTVATHVVHADTNALLCKRCEVDVCERPPPPEVLAARAAHASALLVFMPDRVDMRLLDACPALRIVAGAFKGADNIDVEACTARGVWVTVVPDLLSSSTAELAVGLIIAVARRIREGDAAVRGGQFAGWRPALYGIGLEGTAVGIVGMGSLGRAIAHRLSGFGCRLAYADPAVAEAEGLAPRTLEGLLCESRVVVLAVPLTPTTHELINAERLALMPPGAVLVNVGRGSTVEEQAVVAALDSGRLAGYGADVFAMEDRSRAEAPAAVSQALLDHPRNVFTPHLGSAVAEVRRDIEMRAAESILQALDGEQPAGAINFPSLDAR